MKHVSIFLYILLFCQAANAQQTKTNDTDSNRFQSLPIVDSIGMSQKLLPPKWVQASDGTYMAWIEIKWEHKGQGVSYKLFRNDTNNKNTAKKCSDWLKSNAYLDQDGSLKPGTKYFYWVIAGKSSKDISAYSDADSGFMTPVAWPHGSDTTKTTAHPAPVTGSISLVKESWNREEQISATYSIKNNSDLTIARDVVFYLSTDAYFDEKDLPVSQNLPQLLAPYASWEGQFTLELANEIVASRYFLLMTTVSGFTPKTVVATKAIYLN